MKRLILISLAFLLGSTLLPNQVGIQITSPGNYGPFDFTGGYQGILISGKVKNAKVLGLKHTDPKGYGLFISKSLGDNDNLEFRDLDIECLREGEHCVRIYGLNNSAIYDANLVQRAPFKGTTLAFKSGDNDVIVNMTTDGYAPALGPLPLPSEENYRLTNILFVNLKCTLINFFDIGSGCENIHIKATKRGTINQTNMGVPVFRVGSPYLTRPRAKNIIVENYDIIGGSQLVTGDQTVIKFINCTYKGVPI